MSKPIVAIGPELPGVGSWEWVGKDCIAAMQGSFDILTWRDSPPACDVLVVIKYGLATDVLTQSAGAALVYLPIDGYASASDLDFHGPLLTRCTRIVVHSRTLEHYFRSYAPVEYLDHALKYTANPPWTPRAEGPVLWVGMRNNLPPLVEWTRSNRIPGKLHVLTNLEEQESGAPDDFGFAKDLEIEIARWTHARHVEAASQARLAIDIKGHDFRQKHKPPAKALDFLASGIPLAMNRQSASAQHIAAMGFELAAPEDSDLWTSHNYWEETQRFGETVRSELSCERVGRRFREIISTVLEQRAQSSRSSRPENAAARRTAPGLSSPSCVTKVAILSFLFNWPSTGGGIIHTVELVKFLAKADFDVQLFCARFDSWQIGQVDDSCPIEVTCLEFNERSWNAADIRQRFQKAVDEFGPDHVIITDSWNFKPHLAMAVRGYSYFLRIQAQELLCPLNNLRLLPTDGRLPQQCPCDQLSQPHECFSCLAQLGRTSGSLHQAERRLSGVGSREYNELLRQSLAEAMAVLTLNPQVADHFRPLARRVEVVTWGMDRSRFPWPPRIPEPGRLLQSTGKVRILFAGLIHEPIKGFAILHRALKILAKRRSDFELVVTSDPAGQIDEITMSVGWQSQEALPSIYAACDICVVPTIAQDGLSRTSVEAMASGLPVVASRLGGLPFSVTDGVTGLLFEPGDAENLAEKLDMLIKDRQLRAELGNAGRRVFEERFTWEQVIDREYVRLLSAVPAPS